MTRPARRTAFAPLEAATDDEMSDLLAAIPAGDRGNLLAAMRQVEAILIRATDRRRRRGDRRPSSGSELLAAHPRTGRHGLGIACHGTLYHQEFGWYTTFEALVAGICADFVNNFDPGYERCWIAEDDAGPLGCVFLVRKSASTAKLRTLLVEPRARSRGLGKRLVDECLAFARKAPTARRPAGPMTTCTPHATSISSVASSWSRKNAITASAPTWSGSTVS